MEIFRLTQLVRSHACGLAVRCRFEGSAIDVLSDAVARTAAVGAMDGPRGKQQAARRPCRQAQVRSPLLLPLAPSPKTLQDDVYVGLTRLALALRANGCP